jgi:hypothetical protein
LFAQLFEGLHHVPKLLGINGGMYAATCDGTYKMLFREGSFVDCTIEDTKLKREEEEGREEV